MKNLEKGERIEDLQCGGLKIIQNKDLYTFTSDSVLLANFVKLKRNDKVLEIGGGSGVISILLSAKTKCQDFTLVELQKEMANLCQKNIALNNLSDKLSLVCDDIKNWKKHFVAGQFDAVFSNPPYMKGGTGNKQEARNIARHEENLPLEDLVSVAGKLLKEGGSFWCVYCSDRACELIIKLHKERLETKEMFFTENGKGKVARVVLRAVKGGKSGVKIYPNLVTNDSDGKYIEALQTRNFLK